jgi:hypothetical protein
MVPIIYTTYGMAMRHHPEVLATSGGLRPASAGRAPKHRPGVGMRSARRWLGAVIDRVRLRQQDTKNAAAGAHGMRAAVLPSNQ